MEETKKYRVIYHLGEGVEAVDIKEASSAKEAADDLDIEEIRTFTGENGILYKFKIEDVKMISVEEYGETGAADTKAFL